MNVMVVRLIQCENIMKIWHMAFVCIYFKRLTPLRSICFRGPLLAEGPVPDNSNSFITFCFIYAPTSSPQLSVNTFL